MNLFYLLPMLEYLKSAMRSRSFENVRNKNGCVVSSAGKVDLSFVLMILFNHCHFNKFLWIGFPLKVSKFF